MDCETKSAWPGIIFIVVLIITLIGIAFAGNSTSINQKVWTFAIVLVFGIIWLIIIYWYCVMGYHSIGWFLLILPLVLYLSWKLSDVLARATTNEECVSGDKSFNLMWIL
jgi:uncharacterized membrane protein